MNENWRASGCGTRQMLDRTQSIQRLLYLDTLVYALDIRKGVDSVEGVRKE